MMIITAAHSVLSAGAVIAVPAALIGAWVNDAAKDCASSKQLQFLESRASLTAIGFNACVYTGLRQQHATRWYVDLSCADGAIGLLDINKLDDNRLMIAERPLGVAHIYKRCE